MRRHRDLPGGDPRGRRRLRSPDHRLAVGETPFISLDDVAFDDVLLTGFAAGSDVATGSLVDSDTDVASVNIVNPDIDLDVTCSADGSCPGYDSIEVAAGSDAWLCYDVTNLGDAAAYDLIPMDETYGFTWTIDSLLPGESAGFLSEPILLVEDAFAAVDGLDELDFYLYDGDAAIATVTTADLAVTMDGTDKIITSEGTGASYTLTVVNLATTTVESDLSNNSDSVTTLVAPGATRTIGFCGRHPAFLEQCLDYAGGSIDLGFVLIADESADDEIDVDADSDIENGLELGLGMSQSSVTKLIDRSRRTKLEQARMHAGHQVLVATCNANMLGGSTTIDFTGAAAIMAGDDVDAILALSHAADTFNNSGDDVDLGVNPGKTNAQYPYDDPTDPND